MPNPHVDADDHEHPLFSDAPGGSRGGSPTAAEVGALDGAAAVGAGAAQQDADEGFLRDEEPVGDFLDPDDTPPA